MKFQRCLPLLPLPQVWRELGVLGNRVFKNAAGSLRIRASTKSELLPARGGVVFPAGSPDCPAATFFAALPSRVGCTALRTIPAHSLAGRDAAQAVHVRLECKWAQSSLRSRAEGVGFS